MTGGKTSSPLEEVARRLNTQKSAISRMENRSGDIRLSTLVRSAIAHDSLEAIKVSA